MGFQRRQRLYTGTSEMGATHRETFRQIAHKMGAQNGYLTGMWITISGWIQASEPAALFYPEIWKMIKGVTMRGLAHEWLTDIPGAALTLVNLQDDTLNPFKASIFRINDVVVPTADVPVFVEHNYYIPIAPRHVQPGNKGKGNKDGMFPLAALLEQGEITINLGNALPDPWSLDGNLKVEVHIETYWTEAKILPAPWKIDWFRDPASDVQFSSRESRIDMLFACDDEFGTFTQPTGRFKIETDTLVIQDEITGRQAVIANEFPRVGATQSIFSELLPMISPIDVASRMDQLPSTILRVRDANTDHAGSLFYLVRRALAQDASQSKLYAGVLNIPEGQVNDQSQLTIGKLPAAQLRPGHGGYTGLPFRVG